MNKSNSRNCINCGNLFLIPSNHKSKQYCCRQCYIDDVNNRHLYSKKHIEQSNETLYSKDPKICIGCNTILGYNKRSNTFCSSSCSATYNNTGRVKTQKSKDNASATMLKKGKKLCHVSWCTTCKIILPNSKNQFCKVCLPKRKSEFASERNKTIPFGGHTSKLKTKYTSMQGFTCNLQSSYELIIAQDLDKNNIKWVRPSPLKWIDVNNVTHRYYPDFYLVNYNIYLDPKNDFLIEKDKIKIETVSKQNNIQILILSKNQLSWNYIETVVGPDGNDPPYPTCKEGVLPLN